MLVVIARTIRLSNKFSVYIYTNIVERKHNNKGIQNQDFLHCNMLKITLKKLFQLSEMLHNSFNTNFS